MAAIYSFSTDAFLIFGASHRDSIDSETGYEGNWVGKGSEFRPKYSKCKG
jgi:hypothetical protein